MNDFNRSHSHSRQIGEAVAEELFGVPISEDVARKLRLVKACVQLEQEGLIDTGWLATSPVQIRQLWHQVGQLIGQKMTELQIRLVQNPSEPNSKS